MYTFIAQDFQGNFFISKQQFNTSTQAEEEAYSLAEYDFICSIDIVKCEDVICFNSPSILN
jgi:hypothetical protein